MIMIDTSFLTALLNEKEKDYKLGKQNLLINYSIKSLKGKIPTQEGLKNPFNEFHY